MLIFKGSKSTWNDGKDAVYQTICNGRYGCYNGKWIDFAEKLFYEETAKRFFDQMNINSNETKFSYRMKGANNMNDILEQRLSAKKRDLENQQEYFRIDIKNIEQSNYEDNAINALLYMKKLKTEIAELELVMQLKKTNEI